MVEDDPDVRMPDTGCLSKPNIVYILTIVETIKIGLPVYIAPMTWPNENMADRSSLGRWNQLEQEGEATLPNLFPLSARLRMEPDVPPLPGPGEVRDPGRGGTGGERVVG